ncbi:hypothetical protein ACQKDS_14195 [Serratia sp. NPDC078593]|uniref:hypothetical protein n=1 Tax=unclassified Serratia (in: enterobacteria) TaxID=2647522 RepID=UPI0037D7E568
MKNCRFLVILPIVTLVSCTQWERPGGGEIDRQADYAECEARGFDRFPPDVVRDFEFDYSDKYVTCEKNKKTCPNGYRFEPRPSFRTVQNDRNASARSATIESCMYGKGWHEKTYYWPQW